MGDAGARLRPSILSEKIGDNPKQLRLICAPIFAATRGIWQREATLDHGRALVHSARAGQGFPHLTCDAIALKFLIAAFSARAFSSILSPEVVRRIAAR